MSAEHALEELHKLIASEESGSFVTDKVAQLCSKCGIPSELRGKVWQHLLGVYGRGSNALETWDTKFDRQDQAQIQADCRRTRRTILMFREDETLQKLELLLTLYCKRRSIKYMQGLNELLAPFFLLGLDLHSTFNCLYAMVAKFLPNIYNDELETVKCGMDLFHLLLMYALMLTIRPSLTSPSSKSLALNCWWHRYHDPELCLFLDNWKVISLARFQLKKLWLYWSIVWQLNPLLYALKWVLTLFAYKCGPRAQPDQPSLRPYQLPAYRRPPF